MREEVSNLKDQLLVMDAQDGSSAAMGELVQRWNRRIWQHAYRLTGNVQGSWDITQQSWLGIIKGIGRLNDPACFKPWIYRIATNKSMDWLKKNMSHNHVCIDDTAEPTSTEYKDIGLEELIARLDVNKRTVIYLRYFENMSILEISITLKIPAGTVKSRLHNAKNELKELWQNEYGGY